MKTLNQSLSIWLLAIVLVATSCSDDDDNGPKSKTDLLTQATWIFDSGTSTDPLIAAFIVLLEGSEYTFKTDGTYDGVILGVGGTGTWSFADNETKLNIDDESYTLNALSESSLEITQTDGIISTQLKYIKK